MLNKRNVQLYMSSEHTVCTLHIKCNTKEREREREKAKLNEAKDDRMKFCTERMLI